MNPNVKIALDIATYIRDENLKGKERIPTSETLIKKMVQLHDRGPDDINLYLERLQEAHYIFIFNVVNSDPSLFVQAVQAYVYADAGVINELRHYTEQKLAQIYESTFYKKKSGINVLRELSSKIKEYNNTDLGRALNELMMLEEYARVISANAFNYADSWRKEKLLKLFREDEMYKDFEIDIEPSSREQTSVVFTTPKPETSTTLSKRPQITPGTSKWQRAVSQFSVKFLLRIHFRKYEFDIVRKLILIGKITELSDFIFIRDYIVELEKMKDKDPILKYHLTQMTELRRLAQAKINVIRKNIPKTAS